MTVAVHSENSWANALEVHADDKALGIDLATFSPPLHTQSVSTYGSADDTIHRTSAMTASDYINGGGGYDTLIIQGNGYYPPFLNLTCDPQTIQNIEKIVINYNESAYLKLDNANVGVGDHLTIDAYASRGGHGAPHTVIDGSAVQYGTLSIYSDATLGTLDGGARGDTLSTAGAFEHLYGNGGNDTLEIDTPNFAGPYGQLRPLLDGGSGNDHVVINNPQYFRGTVDGGTGKDTLDIYASTDGLVLHVTVSNVEQVNLHGDHDVTMKEADTWVTFGHSLTIDASDAGSFAFDGSHETDGLFHIVGSPGNDDIVGGEKNDVIQGGSGADVLTGGGGHDTFVFAHPSDSSSINFDRITDLNFSADRIETPHGVTGIDATVKGGALSSANFDADLSHLASSLHVHHAVLIEPSTGTFRGDFFLVIDENGKAGYQAGQDLVIRVGTADLDASHMTVDSFIVS